MGLYNNGYRLGNTPFRRGLGALGSIYNGGGSCFSDRMPTGIQRASSWFFGEYAGRPIGNLAPSSWMLPQKSGAMSMRAFGSSSMSANLIPTRPMSMDLTGSGDFSATAALAVAMAMALTGSGSMTMAIEGRLNMLLDMTGSGDMEADLSGFANMAIEMLGQGDLEATIAAYGNMELDIVVTGTGLSTANVGPAVWAALAASNNVAGTMGEKLNDAGSASNPWTEVIESGYTAAEILKILAAVLAGEVSGAGTGTETFKGLDGTTDRVISTNDSSGNRTNVDIDGS